MCPIHTEKNLQLHYLQKIQGVSSNDEILIPGIQYTSEQTFHPHQKVFHPKSVCLHQEVFSPHINFGKLPT